jgi:hypothetical protein
MHLDPGNLIDKLELVYPILGLYDAPRVEPFEPLECPSEGKHACFFSFFESWNNGKTLHLTRDNSGCGGCGYWMFGKESRPRNAFIEFLADTEGLKDSQELMERWLDHENPYQVENGHLLVGPLREEQRKYLKTVTFFVTPDQLSVLTTGAQYYHSPTDPLTPVIAPFGSGCMLMLPSFKDLDYPQAIIGATDLAMRQYLSPGILSFTVTVPMFRQLCQLDENSFLYKPFLRNLKKSRGEKGIGTICSHAPAEVN